MTPQQQLADLKARLAAQAIKLLTTIVTNMEANPSFTTSVEMDIASHIYHTAKDLLG